MGEKSKKKRVSARGELMRVLNITEDELRANAAGYLTDLQRATLMDTLQHRTRTTGILGRVFASLGVVFLLLGGVLYTTSIVPVVPIVFALLGVIYTILGSAFIGTEALQRGRLRRDIADNAPRTVEGIAVVNINDRQRTGVLEIGGLRLHASPDVLRRVRHMEPYVAHYLPETHTLISLDQIDTEPSGADHPADHLSDEHIEETPRGRRGTGQR